MGLLASPHDLRRGLASHGQKRLRYTRETVKLIMDHNEGIRSDDVLEAHYTVDDRLDLKQPFMAAWWTLVDEQASIAAAKLPGADYLRREMIARRRKRDIHGKGRKAA
jgi:hypothetical protein